MAIDKTHSRYGKLRPWLLYGSIPLGFLTVLCFVPFGGEAKFYFALISYTIYCLAYTAVNTPYSALTNRLTQHEPRVRRCRYIASYWRSSVI
ncbi:Glucuronide permease [Raoultella terrigena]|uniref:Glucuronide permease n=1 Tax=Raoultella terrigena TaxID=577 RepID=A0A4V6YW06_RAOTE|nr:Glucuronide permease [Raoultella terrigena]